jgi:hypothetical protein
MTFNVTWAALGYTDNQSDIVIEYAIKTIEILLKFHPTMVPYEYEDWFK